MDKIFLSVVIPSYNEMPNLRKGVLDRVSHFLSKQKYGWEVIIVDDGSNDGSVEFVQDFIKDEKNFKLIKGAHSGKAGAVTAGVLESKGDWVLFTDMDQATPIEEVNKLVPFTKEYEIVIGSRSSTRKGAPWTRALMAKGMIILRSVLVGLRGINDTQCGFKLFRKDTARELFSKLQTFHHGYRKISGSSVKAGFDVELLFLAAKRGYKIKEVAVNWLYVESRRVSPVKDSIEAVEDLITIRKNEITGKYRNL